MREKMPKRIRSRYFSASDHHVCVFVRYHIMLKIVLLKKCVSIHSILVSAAVVTCVSILEPVSVRKCSNGHFNFQEQ